MTLGESLNLSEPAQVRWAGGLRSPPQPLSARPERSPSLFSHTHLTGQLSTGAREGAPRLGCSALGGQAGLRMGRKQDTPRAHLLHDAFMRHRLFPRNHKGPCCLLETSKESSGSCWKSPEENCRAERSASPSHQPQMGLGASISAARWPHSGGGTSCFHGCGRAPSPGGLGTS